MSERSIPEILGWEPTPPEWDYGRPMWHHPRTGIATDVADCDDMLAWLTKRDEHDGIETWSDQGGHVVKLWISMQSWPEEHHGGSLHEALEAAVRAVAGEA